MVSAPAPVAGSVDLAAPAPRSVSHVVVVMLAPFASGAEHQTLALCRQLGGHCRVTLLTNDEFAGLLGRDPFLRAYTRDLAVEQIGPAFPAAPARTPAGAALRAAQYPRLQVRLWRALRRLRPEIVHLVLAPSFFAYAPLFGIVRAPAVLTLSGEMRYARHFYGPAKRLAVRFAAGRADALVVCSADEMANLHAVAPAAVAKATVLDNFTDVARFSPAPGKEKLVTFAARLHPEKGALLFLDAVAEVRRAHPDARFCLFGRGEQEGEVERRIDALGLGGVVERGFHTDLAPHYARSSVFVSCQLFENLGSSSLLEAMASANAVVATDVGQTRQIVDDSVGLLVPPESQALARAITALLDDPLGTAARARQARERVLARYGPGPYVAGLLAVYARVASHRT